MRLKESSTIYAMKTLKKSDMIDKNLIDQVSTEREVLAALDNLLPHASRSRVAMAFAFGLVHGLGFASVLADLELSTDLLVSSLLGFNLGVELGQIVFVAVALPLAYGASRHPAYVRFGLRLGSAAILIIGSLWLAERTLERSIFPVQVRAASAAATGSIESAVDD